MTTETQQPTAQPVWFDISSRDTKATTQFYRDLLGWTINTMEEENYSFISDGDGPPTGGIGDGSGEAPYVGLVAFFPVADLDATLTRANELGAQVVMGPAPTPMGRIAAVKDPEGTVIGLQGQ